MRRLGLTVLAVMVSTAIGAAALRSAHAQASPTQARVTPIEQRMAELDKRIRALETENARLRGVIHVAADGSTLTIDPSARVDIKSTSVNLASGAAGSIKAGGTLTVKGALVAIN